MFPMPSGGLPPPWLQMSQPVQPGVASFWEADHFHDNLRSLKRTLGLLKAVQKELDTILLVRKSECQDDVSDSSFSSPTDITKYYGYEDIVQEFSKAISEKRTSLNLQESLSLEAANSLIKILRDQLMPVSIISNQTSSWEERSVATRFAQKLQKFKRNKRWKKKKRKQIAEKISKEHEMFDKADLEADEWRAKEIAKDIARRKVENMKAIALLKAKEERKRLESELELVLVVEKLQELRSIRIQKLKKQGHFFPEEDDKFLERVRAAVEEEERQAAAAAETSAAKDAIATAEEYRKAADSSSNVMHDDAPKSKVSTIGDHKSGIEDIESFRPPTLESERRDLDRRGHESAYDSVASLPLEFYHYYYGSNNDLGTLIEVRRTWDAYVRPGGSRIPGHWVQPLPPSDEVWASYLVGSKY
uniref:Programmed cell death protein 7 n=1 Tax=Anthurium amnicola TaxID=1678845 RepID=A0A1D1YXZ3_9ARAE